MEFKLTIADPKTGKCTQKAVSDAAAQAFIGKKIGEKFNGESIDAQGYEFEITGGSDYCGFPMRRGITGQRKRVLILKSVGFKGKGKGIRVRKTVCGDAIHEKISQINLKITKAGPKPLIESAEAPEEKEAPKKEEESKEKNKPKEEAEKTSTEKLKEEVEEDSNKAKEEK